MALPTVGLDHSADLQLPVAEAAERLGFDSVWATDHALMSYERESQYPYGHSGTEIALNPGIGWLEPLSALSFVAARTERVGLGTSVLVLPYRNPVLVAQAATLHLLSGDRLILGVGAGWMREEFEALGLDPAERGARTDEYLAVLRTLWRDDPASFEGRFVSFEDVVLGLPPRDSAPPLWVGGNTRAALRRALRHGDGWHGFEVYPEDIAAVRAQLAEPPRRWAATPPSSSCRSCAGWSRRGGRRRASSRAAATSAPRRGRWSRSCVATRRRGWDSW